MVSGTVAFDVVGTLFSLDAPRKLLAEHGAPGLFEVWFSGALRDYFARSHSGGYTPLKDVLEQTLERAGRLMDVSIDNEITRAAMESLSALVPAPGAEAALERLDENGWISIALTNSAGDHTEDLLRRNGLDGYVKTVISCDDLQVSKPHPSVYQEAKKQSLGEPWLIAAHAWDVAGAMTAGMRAIWISESEHIYPHSFPKPDFISDNLTSGAEFLTEATQS